MDNETLSWLDATIFHLNELRGTIWRNIAEFLREMATLEAFDGISSLDLGIHGQPIHGNHK